MPRLIRTLPSLLAAALSLLAADAAAQRSPALSLDATFGPRTGNSERYATHDALDLDLTLGLRTRVGPGTSFAAAFSLGAQAELPTSLMCTAGPGGGAACSRMPGSVSFAALAGVDRTTARGASVRALAGPLLLITDSSPDRGSLGMQGRLDGALPLVRHVALVASARATLLPEHEGASFRLLGLGIGLRLQ